ncbi:MAG: hypothetical protein K2M30_02070, partial [Desulfovibrionaceae bacterium]|nr:hypothetical protein [Desulfovibrionaceae bacterium]
MLDSKTIEIVQSTVPVLKERGEDITKAFYGVLFSRYPQVQPMFDMEKQKTGQQPRALAMAILNGAQNISNLDAIKKSIEAIGVIHVERKVLPEHYPLVGECLLVAIQEVLGDAATPEILTAWEKAYGALAEYYI